MIQNDVEDLLKDLVLLGNRLLGQMEHLTAINAESLRLTASQVKKRKPKVVKKRKQPKQSIGFVDAVAEPIQKEEEEE